MALPASIKDAIANRTMYGTPMCPARVYVGILATPSALNDENVFVQQRHIDHAATVRISRPRTAYFFIVILRCASWSAVSSSAPGA